MALNADDIKKVLVLGAGTMGSGIARLFAMKGFDVNVVDPFTQNLKKTGELINAKENSLFESLTPLSVAGVDCIIEAVTENVELKMRDVYNVLNKFYMDGIISDAILIGSNTSSIPILQLAEALPPQLRGNFMGTHFFNPAHYMKLIELIPSKLTKQDVKDSFFSLSKNRLNKEVAFAADLPGFIVNRLLVFDYGKIMNDLQNGLYSILELDYVLGTPIGRPMGPFELCDLVGNDLFAPIGKIIYDRVEIDPERNTFLMPPFLDKMVSKKLLGAKSGGLGFYKNEKRKAVAVYNIKTEEYEEIKRPTFQSIEDALTEKDVLKRIYKILTSEHNDRGCKIARHYLIPYIKYAKSLLGIIGEEDDIETAIIYGLNHRVGPIGIARSEYGKRILEIN